ncbi:MAG: SEC-C metal-binding domain-containing protein, partial [Gemmatimonadaceae bacterium]
MSVNRNAPCPCGSGKKYKKCHGQLSAAAVVPPEAARANVLKALDTSLGDRLMRFARVRHGPDWLQNVLEVHGLLDDGDPSAAELSLIVPWLHHFMVNDAAGATLADAWRQHNRQRITPDERLLLDAYDAAWVSLWEVREVEPGVGSRLADVLTGEERFALDVSSSRTLRPYDTLLAIILTIDGVSFFGGAHGQPLPPRAAEFVTREARRMCRVRTRAVTQDKLRDPAVQLDLLALWNAAVQDIHNQPTPSLQNTDGDPFALTTDDFALVVSRDEVAHRLASVPGAQGPEHDGDSIVYVVTKAGNAKHRSWDNTIVGRIVLSATRLALETNSTRRADALRSLVETHLRGL